MVVTVIDAERSLAAALTDRRITDRDAAAVRDFLADSRATKGISANRINLYASSLCRMARFLPAGLLAASAADLYAGIAALRGPTAKDGERPYKQNTLQSTITIVRLFYWWAVENGYSEIPVQRIDRLKPPKRDQMTKTAGQMLTPEEVRAIAGACRRSSDRAIVWMLYEGGFRISELTTMTWGQITFDPHGAVVNVDEKTDRPRYIRLIMAAKPLSAWRADYFFDPTPDAPVFLTSRCNPVSQAGAARMLQRAARRAGVEKHITPHIFRHSRITHWVETGLNESVIKLQSWGNLKSPMLATYAHVSDAAIDKAVLEHAGIRRREERQEEPKPVQCPQCDTVNAPNSPACYVCGCPLTRDAKYTVEMLLAAILKEYPEVADALMQAAEGKLTQDRTAVGE